jgi:hypothetical protein
MISMRRVLAAVLALSATAAHAACHPEAGLTIYSGTIGKAVVRVGLHLANGPVQGRYAYAISTTDIPLRGSLDAAGKNLKLTEYDAAGKPVAAFAGTFRDSDPQFANGSKLNCEVVSGKWMPSNGKPPLPFRLSEDSSTSANFGHLYDVAGASRDEPVNQAAAAFRTAVLQNKRDAVAHMVIYPIDIQVSGRRIKLTNPAALLAHYDGIFTAKFRGMIAGDVPRLMFARDQGIMLGGGEVWFDPHGKVKAFNN